MLRPMRASSIRVLSIAVLVVLLVAYTWITLRTDGRMRTIPFLPYWLTYHLEFYIYERNALAFGLLAMVGAGTVTGLRWEWQAFSLVLCLAAPLAKDAAQIYLETRHFSWLAVTWGLGGALIGWMATWVLLSRVAGGR